MKAEIKILHTLKKVAKNGNKYSVHIVLITIGDQEFTRKFYIFD